MFFNVFQCFLVPSPRWPKKRIPAEANTAWCFATLRMVDLPVMEAMANDLALKGEEMSSLSLFSLLIETGKGVGERFDEFDGFVWLMIWGGLVSCVFCVIYWVLVCFSWVASWNIFNEQAPWFAFVVSLRSGPVSLSFIQMTRTEAFSSKFMT